MMSKRVLFFLLMTLAMRRALPQARQIGLAPSIPAARHVILVSIDGLRPAMYLDSSWPVPNLRWLMRHGVYADHMRSVFPAYTYPSHTAMVTGALPARSGIYYNQPRTGSGQWDWFAGSIRVPTLWRVLRQNGLKTSAVQWPLSAMDTISYCVPEIFDFKHPGDRITLTRGYATPGLLDEIEKNATGRLDSSSMSEDYFSIDDQSARMAGYIFVTRRPAFLAIHLPSVDGKEHEDGPDSDSVRLALAASDHDIGLLLEAVARSGAADSTVVIVVGDHGMSVIREAFRPNLLLAGIGAKFVAAGGSAFLYPDSVQNRSKKNLDDLASKVLGALDKLPVEKRKLFRILDRAALDRMGADSSAILALAAVPGLVFSGAVKAGPVVNNGPGTAIQQDPLAGVFYPVHGGHHGYDPNLPEMYTGFIAAGPGVRVGGHIADLCVVDIAPLVAELLGVRFVCPDGRIVAGILIEKP
jgi:predicted AlkP superfamily pyrophosphatase or phosphodiesterase